MQHSSRTRKTETQRKLLAYSAAAGAAIAGGNAAEGEIIYSGDMEQDFGSGSGTYTLTMEGEDPEFEFGGYLRYRQSPGEDGVIKHFSVEGQGGQYGGTMAFTEAQVVEEYTENAILNLTYGRAKAEFYWFTSTSFGNYSQVAGNWTSNGQAGYMGLQFQLESTSDWVVGWAEIQRVDGSNGKLLGWAYEDSGGSIQAGQTSSIPEPNSLALLALGAAGVATMRRRRGQR